MRWRASQPTLAIATCAGVALAAAVVVQLIAFAAPLLGVLCSISWRRPVPVIQVHGDPDSQRCFEERTCAVTVWVWQNPWTPRSSSRYRHVGRVQFSSGIRVAGRQRFPAVAQRWGHILSGPGSPPSHAVELLMGAGTVDAAEIVVFPLTHRRSRRHYIRRRITRPWELISPGASGQVSIFLTYVPGDQLRAVNWW